MYEENPSQPETSCLQDYLNKNTHTTAFLSKEDSTIQNPDSFPGIPTGLTKPKTGFVNSPLPSKDEDNNVVETKCHTT